MTTPATQSSSALGRRSLPSTFFESIQNARRYMDRRSDTDGGMGAGPENDSSSHAEAGESHTPDLAATSGQGVLPANPLPENDGLANVLFRKGSQGDLKPGDSQSAKPMAFAEVARRVWSVELGPDLHTNPTQNPDQRPLRAVTPASAASVAPVVGEKEVSAYADAAAATVLEAADKASTRQAGAEQGAQVGEGHRLAQDLAQGLAPGLAQAEAQGLAHDANNLLSALRLYSELLCFSGVLHERHRHYAEDLKLLSLRSERLIERLLLLAEQVGVGRVVPRDAEGTVLRPAPATSHAADGVTTGALTEALMDGLIDGQAWPPEPLPEPLPGTALPVGTLPEALPETVCLVDTVKRISGVLETIARGALEVSLVTGSDLQVAIGEEPLERILVNLVANAAAAVREGGAIRIRIGAVEDEPGFVALTVDDSGRGMSEADLAAALGKQPENPFSTKSGALPDTDSVPVGAATDGRKRGLGLAIVRQLVAESRGSFSAYSQLGRGTRIEIRWACADTTSLHRLDTAAGPDLPTGSQSGLETVLQARPAGPESKIRPLPFVSWKNPVRPSLAAGPVSGTDAGVRGGLSKESPAKGAVAC